MARTSTVTRLTKSDWNGDGVTDSLYETVTVTDKKGNVLSQQDRSDYFADGTWDNLNLTTTEYNNRGQIVSTTYDADYDGDGKLEYTTTTTNEWRKDLLLSAVTTYDSNDDGVDSIYSTFNTYNNRGQITEMLQNYDWDADGNTDTADRYSYTYENNQLVRQIGDYGDNGTIDFESDYSYQTDKRTNTVTRLTNADNNLDGIRDTNSEEVTVTDRKGNVLSIQNRDDYNLDGQWDTLSLRTNEYDRRGHVTLNRYDADYENDGKLDYTLQTEYTWNRDLIISEVETSDTGADGADTIYSTFNTYNHRGNLTETLRTFDTDGDGTVNSTDRYTYTYENNRLVQETGDYANDGIIDYVTDILYA